MSNFNLFVRLQKVDAKQRIVYGKAATETPDHDKEIFDYGTSKPYFEKWSESISKVTDGKSMGNVRAMHKAIAAGRLDQIGYNDATKDIDVAAHIVDDNEWEKVEKGIYTGFSVGGKYVKRWKDGEYTRYTAEPSEISLVDRPCVPDATFTVIKADGTEELRKFIKAEAEEPSNAMIAAKATELAKAVGDADWTKFIDPARDALKVQSTWTPEQIVTFNKSLADIRLPAPVLPHGVTSGDDGTESQVWIHKRLPGKTFDTKAAMREALIEADASDAVNKQAKPVLDELKKLQASVEDPKAPVVEQPLAKKDYTEDERKAMAGKGQAMKDGSFPIANKDDLENAVSAYGRAKNKIAARRHIIQRAKELKATDVLPADWPGSTKGKSEKLAKIDTPELMKAATLYSVSNLIGLLGSLELAEEALESGSSYLDGSTYPSYYNTSAGTRVEVPKELCDRFGALLVEFGDCTAALLDCVLSSMKEEESSEAMKMAGHQLTLMKAGARHSQSDQSAINSAHDYLVKAGAACEGGKTEKVETVQELQKQLTAERGAFERTLSEISTTIKDVAARVIKIEKQPVAAGPQSYRVVEKTDDTRRAENVNPDELLQDPNVLEKLADIAIRGAHSRPLNRL